MQAQNIKCIILAAGSSKRLQPLTNTIPKCLLSVGGKTLLQRALENVYCAGIQDVGIVVGFLSEKIRDYMRTVFPSKRIRLIMNPNFESTNNAYSLLLAQRFLQNSDQKFNDTLLLDSDILFGSELLPFLLRRSASDIVTIRVLGKHDAEEIKVKVNDSGMITHIGKDISFDESRGESIGIELFSARTMQVLFKILAQRIRKGDGRNEFYESAFQQMIDQGLHVHSLDASAFPTIEIDTMEDYHRAQDIASLIS